MLPVRKNLIAEIIPPGGDNPLKLRLVMGITGKVKVGVFAIGALIAQGGTAPYAFAITNNLAGFTAAGFALDSATGGIAGTPTTAGKVEFIAEVQDADTTVFRGTFAITVDHIMSWQSATPTPGEAGFAYSYTFKAIGNTGAVSYAVTSGTVRRHICCRSVRHSRRRSAVSIYLIKSRNACTVGDS